MTAQVILAEGDLRGLLRLEVDALAVPLGPDRAQPRGVAGVVDWRLGGQIARWIVEGRFSGRAGEDLLTVGGPDLGADRVFLFGMGHGDGRAHAVEVLDGAQALEVAIAPRSDEDLVEAACAWLRAMAERKAAFKRVVLLDPDGELSRGWYRVEGLARELGFEVQD